MPTGSGVQAYIQRLDAVALGAWESMQTQPGRRLLWPDLPMGFIAGTTAQAKVHSGNIWHSFCRLLDIALAWATRGSALYARPEVGAQLVAALDYMALNHYTPREAKTPFFGNWWHWEIGSPIAFLQAVVLLHPLLTPKQVRLYTAAVNRFCPNCNKASPHGPNMTGGNLIDKGMAVALSGVLGRNAQKLTHVHRAYKTVFQTVKKGDGFYRDGSFVQHAALAYMGGYGQQMYEKLGLLFSVLQGTPWQLSYPDGRENMVFHMIHAGIEPFFYGNLFMDMVSGRDVTRQYSSDALRGCRMLVSLLPLYSGMQSGVQKQAFGALLKHWLGADEGFFYAHCTSLQAMKTAQQILADASILPRRGPDGGYLFPCQDKFVYRSKRYTLGISMHSERIFGHELINDEGKQTWNISDGMMYLYLPGEEAYSGGFWPAADPTRLPGTTVEHRVFPDGAGDRQTNLYAWVGGAVQGPIAAVGMHYKAHGTGASPRDGAEVKKSWFLLGDIIVALGSGITSATGNTVETIVENRQLPPGTAHCLTLCGAQKEVSLDGEGQQAGFVHWAHLQTGGQGIGYHFFAGAEVQALVQTRKGNWAAQGTTQGEESAQFASLWLTHGANPQNSSYAYALLPGCSVEQVRQAAHRQDVEILCNSPALQAVHSPAGAVTCVNFWQAGRLGKIDMECDRPASIVLQKQGTGWRLTVADPTHKAYRIKITLGVQAAPLNPPPNVRAQVQGGRLVLWVNTRGLAGAGTAINLHGGGQA